MENLPGRGFGATCCTCVSFAWEIVRDSPMVNFVSQTMNKHIKMRLWSSAAKSMLPGNAKCSMTSLADTKHIVIERFMKPRISQQAKTARLADCARASRTTRL